MNSKINPISKLCKSEAPRTKARGFLLSRKNNTAFISGFKTGDFSRGIKAGITLGDPAGIGPEITAKSIKKLNNLAEFTVIGDLWVFNRNQKPITSNQNYNYKFIDLKNVSKRNFKFGKIKAEYGRASMEYLDKALEMLKNKELDCLITCPISKEAINLAGYKYNGHTEYLSERTNTKNPVMMLLNNKIKTSLVTRHIPLKKVSCALNQEKIYQTVLITYQSLKKLFFIKNPSIVICGLNPHASDNGLIGDEENRVIIPALNKLRAKIKQIEGPLPADIAIAKTMLKQYDCVITIYHDQSLIPLKLSGAGVNITLGLPIIRTSPLHGTAFDIAGKNQADCTSLNEAIKLAIKCALNLKNA
ncbi:MAG: 4-hydroxythreonine-4-phosphate dehydrogenase PdxA [Candidatus Omnitrophota bacterium]